MKKEFTPFGAYFLKLRKSKKQTLAEAATLLGVSISYISAVGHGERELPSSWRDKLIAIYNLSPEEIIKLDDAIANTPSENKIPFSVLEQCMINLIKNLLPEETTQEKALIELRIRLKELRK